MTLKRRSLSIVAYALLAVSSANAQYAGDHPRSKVCSFWGGGSVTRGEVVPRPSTITMNNDGGWCGGRITTTMGASVFGAPMRVVQQPAHGPVSITVLTHATEILYKPNPDYIGPDSFSAKNETYNIERSYNVVVK
jgi:hypothetical protein